MLWALREQGLVCAIVERWNPNGGSYGIQQDAYGIIDVFTLDPQRGFIGIQSTGQDFAGHFYKLTEEKAQECLDWLSTPVTDLELWAWRKAERLFSAKEDQTSEIKGKNACNLREENARPQLSRTFPPTVDEQCARADRE